MSQTIQISDYAEVAKLVVHCKRQPYDFYIGRGRDPKTGVVSKYGNPFSHQDNTQAAFKVSSREEAVYKYKVWLYQQIKDEKLSLEDLAALEGKVLGCWCAPKLCHGLVLAAAARWAKQQLKA